VVYDVVYRLVVVTDPHVTVRQDGHDDRVTGFFDPCKHDQPFIEGLVAVLMSCSLPDCPNFFHVINWGREVSTSSNSFFVATFYKDTGCGHRHPS
jgi:hypothetical protein